MPWSLDTRIPLRLLAPADFDPAVAAEAVAQRPFALLVPEAWEQSQGGAAAVARFAPGGPRHAAACACCAGRPPVAAALDQLFQARVRGTCAWFITVLALVPDAAARQDVEAALLADPLTVARFRPG